MSEDRISAASRRVIAAREASYRSRVWVDGECRRCADELRAAEAEFAAAVAASGGRAFDGSPVR